MLPKINYSDNETEQIQESFTGGLNRTEYKKSGDILSTENMSSISYPVLRPRGKRRIKVTADGEIIGLGAANKLYYAASSGNGYSEFYYGGEKVEGMQLTEGEKSFCNLGDYIIIYPDMMYYFTGEVKGTYTDTLIDNYVADALWCLENDTLTKELTDGDYYEAAGSIYMYNSSGEWNHRRSADKEGEGAYDKWKYERIALSRNATSRWVYQGKRFGKMSVKKTVSVKSNFYITDSSSAESGTYLAIGYKQGALEEIRAGDSVKIFCLKEGDTPEASMRYTAYVRVSDINYDTSADIDVFSFDYNKDLQDAVTDADRITIEREVPELSGIFECNMRLWGYKEDSIFASGLGNPFTWSTYQNDSEAWSINTETAGDITSGCNYDGYPMFFKEDYIFKITGGVPSDFNLSITPVPGMGCIDNNSIICFGGSILYLSPKGFLSYSGVFPVCISEPLAEEFTEAHAGFDGEMYYTTAKNAKGEINVYVFDTDEGIWLREDSTDFKHYTFFENVLYAARENEIFAVGDHDTEEGTEEDEVLSFTEFVPFDEVYLDKKVLKNISIRVKTEKGASLKILKRENGAWILKKEIGENFSGTCFLRCAPRRGDSYSLKIEGKGDYVIYAVSREYAIRSKKG